MLRRSHPTNPTIRARNIRILIAFLKGSTWAAAAGAEGIFPSNARRESTKLLREFLQYVPRRDRPQLSHLDQGNLRLNRTYWLTLINQKIQPINPKES